MHSVCGECLTPLSSNPCFQLILLIMIKFEIFNTSYHGHELHFYCSVFISLLLFLLQHMSCWTPDWLPGGKRTALTFPLKAGGYSPFLHLSL